MNKGLVEIHSNVTTHYQDGSGFDPGVKGHQELFRQVASLQEPLDLQSS